MITFDAPDRETCKTRRSRTNTPLQALLLMNDRTYVEAAGALAQRMIRAGEGSSEKRLRYGFRSVLARQPRTAELSVLTAALRRNEKIYRDHPTAADALTAVLGAARDTAIEAPELAAYMAVCNVLLNLDKTITRE